MTNEETPRVEEEPGEDMIFIRTRLGEEMFDAAPDRRGVVLAILDRTSATLVDEEGGDPGSLGITVVRETVTESETGGKIEPYRVVTIMTTATRPGDWVRPEPAVEIESPAPEDDDALQEGTEVES